MYRLKRFRIAALWTATLCWICPLSYAASFTTSVSGAAAPYDQSINTTMPFGVNVNGQENQNDSPTLIYPGQATGLSFTTRNLISIKVTGGNPIAGANGTAVGRGGSGVPGWPPNLPGCTEAPGCYTGSVTYLEQLLGAWTDGAGLVIGKPFIVGDEVKYLAPPAGTARLQLGFNDAWYNDNGSAVTVQIDEILPCKPISDRPVEVVNSPRNLILPETVQNGLTIDQLGNIATSLGYSGDGILRGWTIPLRNGEKGSIGIPIPSGSPSVGDAGGGLPGVCFFLDQIAMTYPETLQTWVADAGDRASCSSAIRTHEAHHRRDLQGIFVSVVVDIAFDAERQLPGPNSPMYVENESLIQDVIKRIISRIIIARSGPANDLAKEIAALWEARDYPRVDAICRVVR